MRALRELFDNQSHQSDRLAGELAEHEGTLPQIMAAYRAADRGCIELAGQLNAARTAGSATCLELEAELRKARLERDRPLHEFRIKRDRLHCELENLGGPAAAPYQIEFLDLAKKPPAPRRLALREGDSGGFQTLFATTNQQAFQQYQALALRAACAMGGMKTKPIREIREAGEQFKRELAAIDLLEVREEEVSRRAAADLRESERPETPRTQPGWLAGSAVVGPGGRLDDKSAAKQQDHKISALKQKVAAAKGW